MTTDAKPAAVEPASPEAQKPQQDILEQLSFLTTRIETFDANGGALGVGTGFLVRLSDEVDNTTYTALVTNKHVVEGAKKFAVHLSKVGEGATSGTRGTPHRITWTTDELPWVFHSGGLDLAACPARPVLAAQGGPYKYKELTRDNLFPDDELRDLFQVEEIIFVGYPNGWWDQSNNQPIMRRGFTATHPALNYNGHPHFVIDAAVFPGSSGSPVFILNQTSYRKRNGLIELAGGRVGFIGVVYKVGLNTVDGEVLFTSEPAEVALKARSGMPNHLGLVIHASKVFEFMPEFRKRWPPKPSGT
jgi:hypothetical protein